MNKQKHQVILPSKPSKIINKTILEVETKVSAQDNNFSIKGDNPPKKDEDSSKENNAVKKEKEYVYETRLEVMKIKGQRVGFRPKAVLGMNYLEFHNDFAFEGGGCLKFITKDPSLHYRYVKNSN